jgi:hypothetical protein
MEKARTSLQATLKKTYPQPQPQPTTKANQNPTKTKKRAQNTM